LSRKNFLVFCEISAIIILLHLGFQEVEVLKRYQVLLPGWLEDYHKFLVDRYDLSFSEVLRIALCIEVLTMVPLLYPAYKPELDPKKIADLIQKKIGEEMDQEELYRFMSKIYFEARKAAEYRLNKEKKQKKK
jgi:hypothetical protein